MKKALGAVGVLVAGFGLYKLAKGLWAYTGWDDEED